MAELSVTRTARSSPPATAASLLFCIRHAVMIGQEVAGLTIGRRPGPFSQHRVVPTFPLVLEAIEDIRVPALEIGSLARILQDVKKELVAGNSQILPVAVAHGALLAGLKAPEQLASMRRSAAGQRRQ